MKTYRIILLVFVTLFGVNAYTQSDVETIRRLLRFTYFSDPTVDRRSPINQNEVPSEIENGRFWEDSGIEDLQNFVRAVYKDPSNGGDADLQHSIASVLKLTNRRIIIYLWNDDRSLTRDQYAHEKKPCVKDYDRSDNGVNNRVWPCASHYSREEDSNWGGYVHMGQYYATYQGTQLHPDRTPKDGLQELKATFIHEFMHTQDAVDALNERFEVNDHQYRYGSDGTHFFTEAVPNRRMAYVEAVANTMSLMFHSKSLQRYLNWYANNGNIMVETQMPSQFSQAFRERMGYSDDVWLYNQIRDAHGAGEQHPNLSNYETYPIRSLRPEFIVHNEMILAMSLGITSLHVRDIDPFMYAVKKVNRNIVSNQERDPFAMIVNKFALGLTTRGDSLTEIKDQLESNGVQDQPYYVVLPLAYFDFFTGFNLNSKAEFKEIFNDQITPALLDMYWNHFKDRVRTVSIEPVPNSSGGSRSSYSRIWDNLTDVAIQCGVNQSMDLGNTNFNFEPNSSSRSSASGDTASAPNTEESSVTNASDPDSSEENCQDWPSFGEESSISVNGVTVPVFNANDTQKRNIEQTLSRVPSEHLNSIPRIIIVSEDGPNHFLSHPRRGGASWRCSPANRADEWIKLSAYSLSERRNQRVNFTLLHELGHFIDRDYNILSGHREEARRYLRETNYSGHTQGAGEAIAQGYMYYFASTTAQDRRPRVRDRLPVYLKDILENSSAWSNSSSW
ncbi:hypothetical protein [Aquimarina spongiae]|uniref:Uncharacterized protein n=1 Tax=Aquimarina spongiae TaxID=570521 RepID=A0A1M6IXE2_9FLAO|nr:hypothetical protein [Aquimarina spongiae]SHJ39074.1 hypothetical protein SAMN04488508_108120 [Aquimarina spongiae]